MICFLSGMGLLSGAIVVKLRGDVHHEHRATLIGNWWILLVDILRWLPALVGVFIPPDCFPQYQWVFWRSLSLIVDWWFQGRTLWRCLWNTCNQCTHKYKTAWFTSPTSKNRVAGELFIHKDWVLDSSSRASRNIFLTFPTQQPSSFHDDLSKSKIP